MSRRVRPAGAVECRSDYRDVIAALDDDSPRSRPIHCVCSNRPVGVAHPGPNCSPCSYSGHPTAPTRQARRCRHTHCRCGRPPRRSPSKVAVDPLDPGQAHSQRTHQLAVLHGGAHAWHRRHSSGCVRCGTVGGRRPADLRRHAGRHGRADGTRRRRQLIAFPRIPRCTTFRKIVAQVTQSRGSWPVRPLKRSTALLTAT